jgi:hypothetical protein
MRLHNILRYTLPVICCYTLFIQKASAYQLKPVIIQLFAAEQPDTMGFNLATALPAFLYEKIISGEVKLYDSPEKSVEITPSTLKQIEQTNNSRMVLSKSIFIHELWTLRKGRFSFFPMGVTISDFDISGKVISYGYIDFQEAFDLLSQTPVHSNANGSDQFSHWDAIKSRRYIYRLIQFGRKVLHDKQEALRILEQTEAATRYTDALPQLSERKLIRYTIDRDVQHNGNTDIINRIEKALRNDKQLYDSAMQLTPVDPYSQLRITSIEIVEVWQKNGEFFDYYPMFVKLYNHGKPLKELNFSDYQSTDFRLFANDVTSKRFELTIIEINKQKIPYGESLRYLNALRSGDSWTQITTHVKKNN